MHYIWLLNNMQLPFQHKWVQSKLYGKRWSITEQCNLMAYMPETHQIPHLARWMNFAHKYASYIRSLIMSWHSTGIPNSLFEELDLYFTMATLLQMELYVKHYQPVIMTILCKAEKNAQNWPSLFTFPCLTCTMAFLSSTNFCPTTAEEPPYPKHTQWHWASAAANCFCNYFHPHPNTKNS